MTTTLQSDELRTKQERFLALWNKWERFVYKQLSDKGAKNCGSCVKPKLCRYCDRAEQLKDRFRTRVWGAFHRYNEKKGAFSTWLAWEFKAFWRDIAHASKMNRDGEEKIVRHDGNLGVKYRRPVPTLVPDGLIPGLKHDGDGNTIEEAPKNVSQKNDPVLEIHLRRVLSTLSAKDQQTLAELEKGLTNDELSKLWGITPQAAHGRVTRLRRKVLEALSTPNSGPRRGATPRFANYPLVFWREFFKTEFVCPEHIYRQLYGEQTGKAA